MSKYVILKLSTFGMPATLAVQAPLFINKSIFTTFRASAGGVADQVVSAMHTQRDIGFLPYRKNRPDHKRPDETNP